MKTINIIGAGNVAYYFGYSLHEAGFDVKCICNRTIEKANELAEICGSMATDDIIALPKTDLTILAVSDDYISVVADEILRVHRNSLPIIHTSGSLTLDVFHKDMSLFGSIWPLQSILKGENPRRMDVPLCVDANTKSFLDELLVVSKSISDKVIHLPSDKKKYAHVAAVISNNFTNHLLTLAESYCRDHDIPFEILKPLVIESIQKIENQSPLDIQTGPGRRKDLKTIKGHLKLIENKKLRKIYKLITKSIIKTYHENS